jgi:L-ribulose-5-phosphate 3-epimerase
MDRREFLKSTVAATLIPPPAPPPAYEQLEKRICMFTDHLGGFEVEEVAPMFQKLGIAGPDLTVRPGGLVKPERAEQDLPAAMRIMKDYGMTIPMMTTAVTSVNDPLTSPLLATAAKIGMKYYKLGYYQYKDMDQWRATRDAVRKELTALAALNKELGIFGGFHNHSGPMVGGTLWDLLELLQGFDMNYLGLFFDPSHATIEGGKNGWNYSYQRAKSSVRMVAIKDFIWEKVKGEWRTRWVPLGEGMVRFPEFLKMLVNVPFPGPITMHIEYDPGGKTKPERYDRALEAALRDLAYLRGQLKAACAA